MSKEEVLEKYISGGERFTNHFQPSILSAMDEYAKQQAIEFANWNDRYMNNPPVGGLASNKELYEQFLQPQKIN